METEKKKKYIGIRIVSYTLILLILAVMAIPYIFPEDGKVNKPEVNPPETENYKEAALDNESVLLASKLITLIESDHYTNLFFTDEIFESVNKTDKTDLSLVASLINQEGDQLSEFILRDFMTKYLTELFSNPLAKSDELLLPDGSIYKYDEELSGYTLITPGSEEVKSGILKKLKIAYINNDNTNLILKVETIYFEEAVDENEEPALITYSDKGLQNRLNTYKNKEEAIIAFNNETDITGKLYGFQFKINENNISFLNSGPFEKIENVIK